MFISIHHIGEHTEQDRVCRIDFNLNLMLPPIFLYFTSVAHLLLCMCLFCSNHMLAYSSLNVILWMICLLLIGRTTIAYRFGNHGKRNARNVLFDRNTHNFLFFTCVYPTFEIAIRCGEHVFTYTKTKCYCRLQCVIWMKRFCI